MPLTKEAANSPDATDFQTVRTFMTDNIFNEIEGDPRIPEGWKPRLKKITSLKDARRLNGADERLPGALSNLIRAYPARAKNAVEEIADLPYLTMRCSVRTEDGDVAVYKVKPGDKVLTRDNGYQSVAWVGMRKLNSSHLVENCELELIHIEPGALAENMPEKDVWVTPAQSFLMTPNSHWKGLGVSELLVRAADLTTLEGVNRDQVNKIGLVQILFDSHEVIMVNGAWTSSLRPDPDRVNALPKNHRDELIERFPELVDEVPSKPFQSARVELKPQTALYLMGQSV